MWYYDYITHLKKNGLPRTDPLGGALVKKTYKVATVMQRIE